MNRCYICNGLAQDYCLLCGKDVCSRCIDDNICRYCKGGVRIGYTPLKNVVNPILFIGGVAVIIIGIILISLSISFIPDKMPKNGGFIYIFPFPFVFVWGSSELSILIPLIMLILLPLLFFIFMKILKYRTS